MRGGFVVSAAIREQLEGVDLLGQAPISNEQELVAAVQVSVEAVNHSCARCQKERARLCVVCVKLRREAAYLAGLEKGMSQTFPFGGDVGAGAK